jgi:hypothetical protein
MVGAADEGLRSGGSCSRMSAGPRVRPRCLVVRPPHLAAISAVLMLGTVIDVRCYHPQMHPP